MQKVHIYFFILLYSASQLLAGNPSTFYVNSIDSLIVDKLPPQKKMHIYDSISRILYEQSQINESKKYALEALEIAQRNNDMKSQEEILLHLININYRLDDYDGSIGYYRQLYEDYKKHHNYAGMSQSFIGIGYNYFQWSKYDSAKIYFEKALDLAERYELEKEKANALRNLGSVYSIWGEYKTALNLLQKSLIYWESNPENEFELARVYNTMGMFYQEINDFEKAHDFYEKALGHFTNQQDSLQIANLNLHIGDIYLYYKNYPRALEYYFSARQMLDKLKHKKLMAIAYSNIGEAYFAMKDYDLALLYQIQSLEIKKLINDKKRLAISYYHIGNIYSKLNKSDLAKENLLTSLEIAKEINLSSQVQKIYKSLSEVYEASGDYKLALKYYKNHISIRDHLYSDEQNRALTDIRNKYQTEKEEKEIEKIKNAELINESKLKNQRYIIGLIILILLFLIVLLYLSLSKQKAIKKVNQELLDKNKIIHQQKKDAQQLTMKLKEANASKDKFFTILAHDLKDPFASFIGFTSLLEESYDEFSDTEKKEIILQIKQTSETTFSLLNNILDWAQTQRKKVPFQPSKINLLELVKNTLSIIKPLAEIKNLIINLHFEKKPVIFGDKNMILTVFLNLLSNAVKFSHKNGEINISAQHTDQFIIISIADNGIGMTREILDKLFILDNKLQVRGTNNESGTGLGLLLCKEFIDQHQGKIEVQSEIGKGSIFSVYLPSGRDMHD